MYIGKLESWTDDKWSEYFSNYILDEDARMKVKQILTLDSKEGVESNFDVLLDLRIINGLGPDYFPDFLLHLLSYLFPFIDWRWHDIMVGLAENKKDLLLADRGLKKYGFISINKRTEEIEERGNLLLILLDILVIAPIKALIVYIFYIFVRLGSRFSKNKGLGKD